MKYCGFCGASMEDADLYCSRCGREKRQLDSRVPRTSAEKEPFDRLVCELAYTGFLFWLPLIFCTEERYRLRSANQGLWALISATLCCTAIRGAGAINSWFSGTILGFVTGGVYALLFILFLSFMMFLMWKCLQNVFAIHRGQDVQPILFFDKAAILRKGAIV